MVFNLYGIPFCIVETNTELKNNMSLVEELVCS